MYRIIFTIIAIIIELLLPRTRYHQRLRGFYDYEYEGWALPAQNPNNGLSATIRAFLRRKKALKKCKKFLTTDSYILTLKNKSTIIVFDTKNKTLSCIDTTIKNRAATVIWAEQLNSNTDKNDNLFESIFDDICISFDQYANYTGILKILKQNFIVQETKPLKNVLPPSSFEGEKIKLDKNREDIYNKKINGDYSNYSLKININKASAEEIAQLPGISIILAKKAVKYRDLHNGFKSFEEFFTELKLSPHFQKKLTSMIIIKEEKKKKAKPKNDERIIDF